MSLVKMEVYLAIQSRKKPHTQQSISFQVKGDATFEDLKGHTDFLFVFPELTNLTPNRICLVDTAGNNIPSVQPWNQVLADHYNDYKNPYTVTRYGYIKEELNMVGPGEELHEEATDPFPSDDEEEDNVNEEVDNEDEVNVPIKEESSLFKAQFDRHNYFPSADEEEEDEGEEGIEGDECVYEPPGYSFVKESVPLVYEKEEFHSEEDDEGEEDA